MERGLVDLYVHERERDELVRLGLVAGSRKREREESDDLARELIDDWLGWTEHDRALVGWLSLPTWKRWLWTAIR